MYFRRFQTYLIYSLIVPESTEVVFNRLHGWWSEQTLKFNVVMCVEIFFSKMPLCNDDRNVSFHFTSHVLRDPDGDIQRRFLDSAGLDRYSSTSCSFKEMWHGINIFCIPSHVWTSKTKGFWSGIQGKFLSFQWKLVQSPFEAQRSTGNSSLGLGVLLKWPQVYPL